MPLQSDTILHLSRDAFSSQPMYLFFSTETTVPRDAWDLSEADPYRWPRLVQLAWLQMDVRGKLIDEGNDLIQPEGFRIPTEAEEVHNISTSQATRQGIRLVDVLIDFAEFVRESKLLIAHNIEFDQNVLISEYIRENIPTSLEKKRTICTMEEAIEFRKMNGDLDSQTPPSLAEFHKALFGEEIAETNDAANQVRACAKCFFELRKRGIVNVAF